MTPLNSAKPSALIWGDNMIRVSEKIPLISTLTDKQIEHALEVWSEQALRPAFQYMMPTQHLVSWVKDLRSRVAVLEKALNGISSLADYCSDHRCGNDDGDGGVYECRACGIYTVAKTALGHGVKEGS